MLMRMGRAMTVLLFSATGIVLGLAFGAFRIGFRAGADMVETYADEAERWDACRASAETRPCAR